MPLPVAVSLETAAVKEVSEAVNIILQRLEALGVHLSTEFNLVDDSLEKKCTAP